MLIWVLRKKEETEERFEREWYKSTWFSNKLVCLWIELYVRFPRLTSYKQVIAVIGFNPDKKYLVSPEERAQLLRDMLKTKGGGTSSNNTNIRVEGTYSLKL